MTYPGRILKGMGDSITDNCVIIIEIENYEKACKVKDNVVKYPKIKISQLKNNAGAYIAMLFVQNQEVLFLNFEMLKTFNKLNV